MLSCNFNLLIGSREEPIHKQTITVNFWNEDIGCVKGGNFLRDQKWILENTPHHIKGPGSGLFRIRDDNINKEECYALFALIPKVTIVTVKGRVSNFTDDPRDFARIGLARCLVVPGYPTPYELDIEAPIISVEASLHTYPYGLLNTGDGSIWMSNNYYLENISKKVLLNAHDKRVSKTLNVAFSWPNVPGKIDVDFKPADYTLPENVLNLELAWKKAIGMHIDKGKPAKGAKWCFPTNKFNCIGEPRSKKHDAMNLDNYFQYYAGHYVEDDIYRQ